MKYHVFAGYYYYPAGGTLDHMNTFDTQQEAEDWVHKDMSQGYDWWHVCESESLEIVAEK